LPDIAYDAAGNITNKNGAGAYSYVAGSNRVANAAGYSYGYDAVGNITSDGRRTLTYTPFNLPESITQGTVTTSFGHNAGHQRQYEKIVTATGTKLTWYAGGFEQIETLQGTTWTPQEWRHYIGTPEGVAGFVAFKASGGSQTRYFLKDHLGTTDFVIDDAGQKLEGLRYDPWGQRRTADNLAWPAGTTPATTGRGYTGHEHLDEVGLIHMNGRVYDPVLGRFLQADPFVQAPYD
jgi:RHS repeat-associated protein